jgi:hypothetical protein
LKFLFDGSVVAILHLPIFAVTEKYIPAIPVMCRRMMYKKYYFYSETRTIGDPVVATS